MLKKCFLSLFDGMSCLQIALKELGITPTIYYASEIDKHAIKQTKLNFPETVQLGDITKWKTWDIDWKSIDFIGAGSPCQGFSFAGKQLAFDDPRSKLFFEFVNILNHVKKLNPNVKFLLENVNMKKEHMRVINEFLGIAPVRINSNLVSAQNRDRWYWTNIKTKQSGLFGELYTDIPQPKDQGIYLKDILEDEVDEKYYISAKAIARVLKAEDIGIKAKFNPEKSGTITTKNQSGQLAIDNSTTFISPESKAPTQRNATGSCMDAEHNYQIMNLDGKLKPNQEKASCFTAGAHSGGNHSDMDLVCVAMRGRNPENPSDRRTGSPTEQRLEPNLSGKTNCLTSVQKDNLVMQLNERQQNNFKNGDEKANTFLSTSCKGSQANGMTLVGETKIRRLTPTECARLQTIPEWYKWHCSDTQQYRMLGNGWTVEVIKHILSYL